jgi:hypothetical protein
MLRVLLTLVPALLLAGCASAPPEIAVAPGQYGRAFDEARETLVRYRFELERVDARTGVITSRPKSTGGLATPWNRDQSTLYQELEDLGNEQRRVVRITFEPKGAAPIADPRGAASPPPEETDLRRATVPMTAHVDVVVERVQHAGWRVEPTAVRYSSITRDPELVARGMWPSYEVAFSQDPQLARRLAEDIRRKLPQGTQPRAGAPSE